MPKDDGKGRDNYRYKSFMMKHALTGMVIAFMAGAWIGAPMSSVAANAGSVDISPDQAAALNQELEAMRAELLNLQTRYAQETLVQPEIVSGEPALLSSQELVVLDRGLALLRNVLDELRLRVERNEISSAGKIAMSGALEGMQTTLVTLKQNIGSAPFASADTRAPAQTPITVTPSAPQGGTQRTNEESLSNAAPIKEASAPNEAAAARAAITLDGFGLPAVIAGIVLIIGGVWIWRATKGRQPQPQSQSQPIPATQEESAL